MLYWKFSKSWQLVNPQGKIGPILLQKEITKFTKFHHKYTTSMLNGVFKITSSDEIWHPKNILHEYMNACLSDGGNYNSNLRTDPWIE